MNTSAAAGMPQGGTAPDPRNPKTNTLYRRANAPYRVHADLALISDACPDISPEAEVLLECLSDRFNFKTGLCFPALKTLLADCHAKAAVLPSRGEWWASQAAKIAALTPWGLRMARQELRDLGLISWEVGKYKDDPTKPPSWKSCRYRFHVIEALARVNRQIAAWVRQIGVGGRRLRSWLEKIKPGHNEQKSKGLRHFSSLRPRASRLKQEKKHTAPNPSIVVSAGAHVIECASRAYADALKALQSTSAGRVQLAWMLP